MTQITVKIPVDVTIVYDGLSREQVMKQARKEIKAALKAHEVKVSQAALWSWKVEPAK